MKSRDGIAADAGRRIAAGFERPQLFLDLERQVEGEQEKLATLDRTTLVGGKWREIVANRDNGDGLGHPMHRHDVGELGPVRIFLNVAKDNRQLSGQEAVGIGQRQQQ